MNIEKIFIASDHAGFELKDEIKKFLQTLNLTAIDLGTNSSEASVDYPDFANLMAENLKNQNEYGILICGTGIGISIAANRHKHIRCALCHDIYTASMAREHNDANIIAFGARTTKPEDAKEMIKKFFSTEFAGGRHLRRVDKLGCCRAQL
ncbi:ribose 5-phosphate isomerase B [Campylobacter sp. RM16192]|uniref:ribose 5-phosphate isomerase B n=1 Tax=Campylobacter sp. RM16192 TaxID=1660080 RepID=UPI0014529545|nr:ribose 5-phosphate isomerase B [Campylobacter sp. RM16192]QCD52937.1 allose-6-phosphate isomerase / ribose-5-phosphate isomerase B [Campylobacter sp. RM16192]